MNTRERLHHHGILRLGTPKRGFIYKYAGNENGHKVSAIDLARIAELKVPPAWTEVAINRAHTGRVQAVGKDAAGRWQYIYSAAHVRGQQRRKFHRLIRFGENLPQLRRAVARHLGQKDLSRDCVLAAILRILSVSFMRPGSEIYANENSSYGIATLRPRHVSVKGDRVYFQFTGKSGVEQTREIRDRQVARIVRELLKRSNRRVFKYQGDTGGFVDVTSRDINSQIKLLMGRHFSAKDFRTWAGTLVCACVLARMNEADGKKKRSRDRQLAAAIAETAAALGNTPAVCRDAYVCPAVIASFEKGEVIQNSFNSLQTLVSYRGTGLHAAEKALLQLLKHQNSNGKHY